MFDNPSRGTGIYNLFGSTRQSKSNFTHPSQGKRTSQQSFFRVGRVVKIEQGIGKIYRLTYYDTVRMLKVEANKFFFCGDYSTWNSLEPRTGNIFVVEGQVMSIDLPVKRIK